MLYHWATATCRSPLGLRGLKSIKIAVKNCKARRSPLGLRGLKLTPSEGEVTNILSQPTRAAWIEIFKSINQRQEPLCRSPLGLRGLKFIMSL